MYKRNIYKSNDSHSFTLPNPNDSKPGFLEISYLFMRLKDKQNILNILFVNMILESEQRWKV